MPVLVRLATDRGLLREKSLAGGELLQWDALWTALHSVAEFLVEPAIGLYKRAWELRSPKQAPPSIVPPPRRASSPGHVSSESAAKITARTSSEFHQNALALHGALRNTSAKIGVTPAMIHHSACTMAGVV